MEQADQNNVPGPTARYQGVPEGAVTLSPEEARKLDARLAKVRDAYFRRLPESDPDYDLVEMVRQRYPDDASLLGYTYPPSEADETEAGSL